MQFLPISVSSCQGIRLYVSTLGAELRAGEGNDAERVPRVTGRRRISSSAPEEGRVESRGELSAQLEGARFSLSPSAGRGGCREGFATLEARVECAVVHRLAPARLFPSPSLTHIHVHIRTFNRSWGSSATPFALVRLCALTYVCIDTQPEAGQVNRPLPDYDETGVVDLSHFAIYFCLIYLSTYLPAHSDLSRISQGIR